MSLVFPLQAKWMHSLSCISSAVMVSWKASAFAGRVSQTGCFMLTSNKGNAELRCLLFHSGLSSFQFGRHGRQNSSLPCVKEKKSLQESHQQVLDDHQNDNNVHRVLSLSLQRNNCKAGIPALGRNHWKMRRFLLCGSLV